MFHKVVYINTTFLLNFCFDSGNENGHEVLLRWNWNFPPQRLKTSGIETTVDLLAFRLLTGEMFFFSPDCRDRLWCPLSRYLKGAGAFMQRV
jgi:hypothetical protein